MLQIHFERIHYHPQNETSDCNGQASWRFIFHKLPNHGACRLCVFMKTGQMSIDGQLLLTLSDLSFIPLSKHYGRWGCFVALYTLCTTAGPKRPDNCIVAVTIVFSDDSSVCMITLQIRASPCVMFRVRDLYFAVYSAAFRYAGADEGLFLPVCRVH